MLLLYLIIQLGSKVPLVVNSFGVKIIEKHFILDQSIGDPDASFFIDEKGFTEMAKADCEAEKTFF